MVKNEEVKHRSSNDELENVGEFAQPFSSTAILIY